MTFDTSLLAGESRDSDLSRFYLNNDMPAGRQEIDVYVNHDWKGAMRCCLAPNATISKSTSPGCAAAGHRSESIADASRRPRRRCRSPRWCRAAGSIWTSALSLRLTVPQAQVNGTDRAGYVDQPSGIAASPLTLAYNATYYHAERAATAIAATTTIFMPGWNPGSIWPVGNFATAAAFATAAGGGATGGATRYLQRGRRHQINLTAGDFYSPGSVRLGAHPRGGALASGHQHAPQLAEGLFTDRAGRGANQRLVKVVQNGNVIYQENVPPGAFTLDSIQADRLGAGDLWVTVKEADGREQSFSVPFRRTQHVETGVSQYSVLAGKGERKQYRLRSRLCAGHPAVRFQQPGNRLCRRSILSDDYQAWLLGSWNLPIGAVSIDLTRADTRLKNRRGLGRASAPTVNFSMPPRPTSRWRPTVTPPAVTGFTDAIYSNDGYRQLERAV
ncbi:fimbria/pilus outer membrane usher protein [Serratia ureilytica]